MISICEHCGHELTVGDYPFCPHGKSGLAAHGDDVPGGFWAENGFSEARKFYSHSEHEKALAAEGCEVRAKWAGPGDKYLTRWDGVDLDSARAFLERHADDRRLPSRPKVQADAVITRQDGPMLRRGDLDD